MRTPRAAYQTYFMRTAAILIGFIFLYFYRTDISAAEPKPESLDPATGSAAGNLSITCGASGVPDWTTFSESFEVILQCSFSAPQDGWAFISADGSMVWADDYEAHFRIGIDNTAGEQDTDRWVNVYDDYDPMDNPEGDGTDESVAISALKWVSAGAHTFYFLGRKSASAEVSTSIFVLNPTLSVIYIPAANSEILACGATGGNDWTTTSNIFSPIHQCSLDIPQNGWVFISASGSLGIPDLPGNNDYEAKFRIGIDDSTIGETDTDRTVNIYEDSGNGTDKSVAVSVLKPVTPDSYTFYFLGRRIGGTGTVQVHDPTLSVIYIPASTSEVKTCGGSSSAPWTTTSSSYSIIQQCSLDIPQDGLAFISANGSPGIYDTDYEAQFSIDLDGTAGDPDTDRWINIYEDNGNGTDKSVAVSVLKPVTKGTHTFYFLGKRYSGTGTVSVNSPTLTVITMTIYKIFLPFLVK